METFPAVLAISAGSSPVPGEFPAQRPVTRSFDVCFDLRLNKRLDKQSWGLWFETLLRPLLCHCNGSFHINSSLQKWIYRRMYDIYTIRKCVEVNIYKNLSNKGKQVATIDEKNRVIFYASARCISKWNWLFLNTMNIQFCEKSHWYVITESYACSR